MPKPLRRSSTATNTCRSKSKHITSSFWTAAQGEIESWAGVMRLAGTAEPLTVGVLASQEYESRHGDTYEWITSLYENVLGRRPEWAGLNGWLEYAATEPTREGVVSFFVDGPEAHELSVREGYHALLGRNP